MFLLRNLDMMFCEMDYTFDTGLSILTDFYMETADDSVIDKIQKLLFTYIDQIKNICDIRKDEKALFDALYHLDKLFIENPKLKNEKIQFRGWDKFEKEKDYDKKMAINLATIVNPNLDKDIQKAINDYEWKKGEDTWYSAKMKDIRDLIDEELKGLVKEMDITKKTLFDFSKMLKLSEKYNLEEKKNIFALIVERVRDSFKRRIYIISLNIESMKYKAGQEVEKEIEDASSKSKMKVELKTDEFIIKSSKKVKSIEMMGKKFDIYQNGSNDMFMLNYTGTSIYVNKDFFTYPKGYQEAIIFHEIGHTMAGHFDPVVMDDYRKYYKRFGHEKSVYDMYLELEKKFTVDENEFVYIMMELEADRFTAQRVGKKQMGDALQFTIDEVLKKEAKTTRDYNKFRAHLRTRMI